MSRAVLREATLVGAELVGANLKGASLIKANLVGANLHEANLTRANLSGADFRGSQLSSAILDKAVYNNRTIFPDDIDPGAMGAFLLAPQCFAPRLKSGYGRFDRSRLKGADLRRTNLYKAILFGART